MQAAAIAQKMRGRVGRVSCAPELAGAGVHLPAGPRPAAWLTCTPSARALAAALAFVLTSLASPLRAAEKLQLLSEECPPDFSLAGTIGGLAKAPAGTAKIVLNYADGANHLALELSGRRAALTRVHGGSPEELAGADLPAPPAEPLAFTLKRRGRRLTLIRGDRIPLRAYDRDCTGGYAGWREDEGLEVDLRLQPTEPVNFTDDFTRGALESGGWTALSGQCGVAEVRPEAHGRDMGRFSSNAFSWAMAPQPVAISTVGYWFWDDYAVEASVKPEGRGAVGLVACLKDERSFLLFRWSAAAAGRPGSGSKEILRVADGAAKVIASEPGGFEPGQWYRLRFTACDGALAAYVDGRLACTAFDSAFGQGKAGLYARDCPRVSFDDVRVVSAGGFRDDFALAEPGKWEDEGTSWETDPAARRRRAAPEGEGITFTGAPEWDDYVLEAEAVPGAARAVGVCFARQGAGSYCVFRVPNEQGAQAQVLRVAGGRREVLAEAQAPPALGGPEPLRLKVDVHRGRARCFVGDELVVESFDPRGLAGQVGLYAAGPAAFASCSIWPRLPEDVSPPIEEQFTHEETMAGWASERGSWDRGVDGVLWHTGVFFADPEVSLDLPAGPRRDTRLAVSADGTRLESGYQLVLGDAGEGKARLQLLRGTAVVATGEGLWPDDLANRRLSLRRDGPFLAGTLGDALTISWRDPDPLAGTSVGASAPDGAQLLSRLEASSPRLLDCTFSGPPTDWWGGRGVWDVAQRWPCDRRWSFFAGTESESPVLWSKRSFGGDVVVEAWVGVQMDAPETGRGYSHPADLELTFCADGKDLSSGYTLQFAALNNRVTRLLRREEVVAETNSVLIENPSRGNMAFHRHWFHLRAEKRGGRIRAFVDGRLAGEFTDPNPLPDGQVALWTWKNGLMVARARVWYEKDGDLQVLPAPAVVPLSAARTSWTISAGRPVSLVSDFERGGDGWAGLNGDDSAIVTVDAGTRSQGKRSLRVANRVSGGPLGVWCGVRRFDAAKFPVLRFDYRVPQDVRINLYFRVDRRWFCVGLSAAERFGDGAETITSIPDFTADDRWHTAEVNLLAALRRRVPGSGPLVVEDLWFRAPKVEYLGSGFGGNRWGSEYHLDNVRLVGGAGTTAADARGVTIRQ